MLNKNVASIYKLIEQLKFDDPLIILKKAFPLYILKYIKKAAGSFYSLLYKYRKRLFFIPREQKMKISALPFNI